MSFNGPWFELIYLIGMGNEGWIGFECTFVYKRVLDDCISVSEQGL